METRRKSTLKMEDFPNVLINAAEFIKRRLFFVILNTDEKPKSTQCAHYFSVDDDLTYDNFYSDFGPLNLAMLYRYCIGLKKDLNSTILQHKKIVHYTGPDQKKCVNAAYLIGSYAVIYLGMEPETAHEILCRNNQKEYLDFRDASIGDPYTISLLDCLKGIQKAYHYGFFNFDNFDFFQYEHYERVEDGDLNWILPNKLLAFCGPHNKCEFDGGFPMHTPETYFQYFRRNKVNTIIRLNKKVYDSNRFVQAGFNHLDLYFVDGGTPTNRIVQRFLITCEGEKGAVAVHCKAGLGRTGTLIACYIMKHYKFTANEAIAWIRICRPGSVVGHQQSWLQQQQSALWKAGEEYRKNKGLSGPIKHCVGIYSLTDNSKKKVDCMSRIMKKVDSMEINDPKDNPGSEEHVLTQGDKLKQIKAQRAKSKPLTNNISEFKTHHSRVAPAGNTIVPSSKMVASLRSVGTTSTRVLSKRNEGTNPRRCSQRSKTTSRLVSQVAEKSQVDTHRQPKIKENVGWLPDYEVVMDKVSNEDKTEKTTKRGKRSLNLEKDKMNPRSIKLLRFSSGQGSQNGNKLTVDITLPVVKLNKTL